MWIGSSVETVGSLSILLLFYNFTIITYYSILKYTLVRYKNVSTSRRTRGSQHYANYEKKKINE